MLSIRPYSRDVSETELDVPNREWISALSEGVTIRSAFTWRKALDSEGVQSAYPVVVRLRYIAQTFSGSVGMS
jgi:hypothetical protein